MKLVLLILLALALSADSAVNFIKTYEGFSPTMYKDNGHVTIGYGTNLSYGITEKEAELLLSYRLAIASEQLSQFEWFNKLTHNRKLVVLSMRYQLGMTGLFGFRDMIWSLEHDNYVKAADAMIDSLWYRQSGHRARELVQLMRKG